MPVLGGHVRTVTGGDVTGIPFCFQMSLVTISVMLTAVQEFICGRAKGSHLFVFDSMIVLVVEVLWCGAV